MWLNTWPHYIFFFPAILCLISGKKIKVRKFSALEPIPQWDVCINALFCGYRSAPLGIWREKLATYSFLLYLGSWTLVICQHTSWLPGYIKRPGKTQPEWLAPIQCTASIGHWQQSIGPQLQHFYLCLTPSHSYHLLQVPSDRAILLHFLLMLQWGECFEGKWLSGVANSRKILTEMLLIAARENPSIPVFRELIYSRYLCHTPAVPQAAEFLKRVCFIIITTETLTCGSSLRNWRELIYIPSEILLIPSGSAKLETTAS